MLTNNKKITTRRASIPAILSEPKDVTTKTGTEMKKVARRPSDYTLRATSRTSRPSRLEYVRKKLFFPKICYMLLNKTFAKI